MTYTAGQLILDDEYNIFVAGSALFGTLDHGVDNLNSVWGTGFGDKGWGQSGTLTQVSPGTTVSATQWQTLFDRLLTADDHQGVAGLGAMPGDGGGGGAALTTGNLIEALATLQANVTSVYDNRLTVNSFDPALSDANATSTSWDVDAVFTTSVQFTSADAARYFFNAGGTIDISATRAGGGSGEDNAAFDQLLPDVNIVRFDAQGTNKIGGAGSGGSGYIEATTFGYHDLITSPSQIFRQYATGYAATNFEVQVQSNGVQDVNGDQGDLITFTVTMATTTAVPPGVDGTCTVNVDVNYPDTAFLPDAPWGVPTFPTSSVVVT